MAEHTKQSVQKPAGQRLLPLAVPVHVQCDGFRCLAYRDADNSWIDYNSGEPLKGEVTLIRYEPE